jgi:hypothetical protein
MWRKDILSPGPETVLEKFRAPYRLLFSRVIVFRLCLLSLFWKFQLNSSNATELLVSSSEQSDHHDVCLVVIAITWVNRECLADILFVLPLGETSVGFLAFRTGVSQNDSVLCYCTVWNDKSIPKFRGNVLPPSSVWLNYVQVAELQHPPKVMWFSLKMEATHSSETWNNPEDFYLWWHGASLLCWSEV